MFRIDGEGERGKLVVISAFSFKNRDFCPITLSKIPTYVQVHKGIPLPLPQRVNKVNFQCDHFFKTRKDQNANKDDTFAGGC